MAQQISLNNIDTAAITAITGPRISGILYPGDDTAASIDGGQTVSLTGTGFQTGLVVYVNGAVVSVTSVVSASLVTFVTPVLAAGSYTLHVVNADGGTATFVPGIQYSGVPSWSTTAGSLGTASDGTAFSSNLSATSDSTVTYSIVSGALPLGVTLNSSTGVISGTLPSVASTTTYNFTVAASDAENQDTNRAFSITVNSSLLPGQQAYTTAGTYSWTAPAGVTSVSVVAVGGGGGGSGPGGYSTGGAGGGLGWKNAIAVTPGQSYTVVVGAAGVGGPVGTAGGDSYFINTSTVNGGGGGIGPDSTAVGGTYTGDGGGNGGNSTYTGSAYIGGGGAGGYSGNGGNGEGWGLASQNGAGGGGGGGGSGDGSYPAGGGGGVGIFGQGTNGAGAGARTGGGGGSSGGGGGSTGYYSASGAGGTYGGGSGGGSPASNASAGAVRIIWGPGRSFPATNTANQ